MAYWKTEYAVATTEDGDEVARFDDRDEAVAAAQRRAANREGSAYQIIRIDRYSDDRTPQEIYLSNGDCTV